MKMSQYYESIKIKRTRRVLLGRDSVPGKYSTFREPGVECKFANRRVGRPKQQWAREAMSELWEHENQSISRERPGYRNIRYDHDSGNMRNILLDRVMENK